MICSEVFVPKLVYITGFVMSFLNSAICRLILHLAAMICSEVFVPKLVYITGFVMSFLNSALKL